MSSKISLSISSPLSATYEQQTPKQMNNSKNNPIKESLNGLVRLRSVAVNNQTNKKAKELKLTWPIALKSERLI